MSTTEALPSEELGAAPEPERRIDWTVFGVAAAITLAIVVWGLAGPDSLSDASHEMLDWIVENLGWFFVLAATGFVVFALWLAFSRYGRIPLGKDGEKPEFRTVSWVAMMFSAGMGIGLMFYGVNEPLTHFVDPPPGTSGGEGNEAMETAMATTLFHWTVHPWAIYAVVGLAIAYGTYRRGRGALISRVFAPLLGQERCEGSAGKAIDVLAIFATLFGSAASLGLGALQIGSGMEEVGWRDSVGDGMRVLIIVVLTTAFVFSAVSGVSRGIQWLSNTNMVLAVTLAVFVFAVGPTVLMLNLVPTSIGGYLGDLSSMSSRTATSSGEGTDGWLASWTIFYWAWWISWTPFVGMFIARISRGRTIRQFVLGVIAVPSAVSLVWFAVLGGSAIDAQRDGTDLAGEGSAEGQLFGLLDTFPWATATGILVMVLVGIFFVSGADAASIVMGTLSQRGTLHPKTWLVVFWGVLMGAIAAVMLLVSGEDALDGLQTLTIIAAAPFAVVMVGVCVALARDLRNDPMITGSEEASATSVEA